MNETFPFKCSETYLVYGHQLTSISNIIDALTLVGHTLLADDEMRVTPGVAGSAVSVIQAQLNYVLDSIVEREDTPHG